MIKKQKRAKQNRRTGTRMTTSRVKVNFNGVIQRRNRPREKTNMRR